MTAHAITSHKKQNRNRTRLFLFSCMAATMATPAFAQLAEAENAGNWVLAIFSPALMLIFLTLLLIGCGIAVFMGKISGGLFVKIILGSILIFGARTIAPRIASIF